MDLPVLIPRVKNGLPRGTRAAFRERQSPQLPTKAVAARGGCVCAPCRPSAVVSATRGESRRLATPTKSAAVSVLTSSPETPPRFSCPRNPLSVDLTLALSCGRGLTRTARSARLRRLTSFGGYPTAAVCPCGARRGYRPALVVARCAAMPRQRDLESAAEDISANCLALARRLARLHTSSDLLRKLALRARVITRLSARRISRRAYPPNSAWSRISPKRRSPAAAVATVAPPTWAG